MSMHVPGALAPGQSGITFPMIRHIVRAGGDIFPQR